MRDKLTGLAKNNAKAFWNEINKTRKGHDAKPSISNLQFFNYFKETFSGGDIFMNPEIENELHSKESSNTCIDLLDREFEVDEVKRAISALKRGKSGGADLLIPEMFLECKDILSPILGRLFNYMYDKSVYPSSWSLGVIVPVPKKGDNSDVNNYRGIALTSIFSKILSHIIEKRLRNWAEQNTVISDYQFGFRSGKSTTDRIFILNSLIQTVITVEKKPLFCAFVDFKKAFDSVYRNGLWLKLLQLGTSSKIINMLRTMYSDVKACVRSDNIISECFSCLNGVKQGEPVSSLMFILFINDLYESLLNDNDDYITLNDLKLFLLLFADDAVLFSYTREGLQILLDRLKNYCDKWGLTVNISKTVVMVCKNGRPSQDAEIYYDGRKLATVTNFSYLGVSLFYNGKFHVTQKKLSEQALRALFALNSTCQKISMNISEKLQLFDTLILPILMYGACIWGLHKADDIEKIHLKFLKHILCVRMQTPTAAIYGEVGPNPLIVHRKIAIMKYWQKILSNPSSLLCKVFNMKDNNGNIVNAFHKNIIQLLNNLGLSFMHSKSIVTKADIEMISRKIKDTFIQNWFTDIENSSKLHCYRSFKTCFEYENYLNCVINDKQRMKSQD